MAYQREPLNFDPRKNADPWSAGVHQLLFEGLTYLEADGSIGWGIATSASEEEGVVLFEKAVGQMVRLTADDFKRSWEESRREALLIVLLAGLRKD